MTDSSTVVYAGVDTHSKIHVAAVISERGQLVATKSFATDLKGLRSLCRWLHGFGELAAVGVEGTGSYGLGLTRLLLAEQVNVIEVNRPNRQLRRTRGKSDPVDAEAAARAVWSGQAAVVPKTHDGIVESIRVLHATVAATRKEMTAITGQFYALMITAPPSIREELEALSDKPRMDRAAGYRPGHDLTDVTAATKTALRMLARRWLALREDHIGLRAHLDALTTIANPTLAAIYGVGPDTAAVLLAAAGQNPHRMQSDAAFAALAGVNPIQASSGNTVRHRLNRGGNRQANAALYRIVIVRMSQKEPRTMAYFARRLAEGKTRPEIIRALKRYIAREVFKALTADTSTTRTEPLKAAA